jgi:phosphoribosylformylglycinamidine synthase subunit PurL
VALVAAEGWTPSAAASELAKLRGEAPAGPLPDLDPAVVAATQVTVRDAVRSGAVASAHDVAEGGVAVALAECCLASALGARVGLDGVDPFGEAPGAFIVSGERAALAALPGARVLGEVGGDALAIDGALELPVEELGRVHARGLADLLR